MARPRLKKYKDLPPNLTYDKKNKQYRYRRPDIKKHTQMGRDRCRAVSAAKQLNSIFMLGQDLVAKTIGTSQTLKQFIETRFIPYILPERQLAESTLKEYHYMLVRILKNLGEKPIDNITIKDISDFLLQFTPTPSNHYRSLLSLIFKYTVAEGHRQNNPAANTMKRNIEKKRKRLSLEMYKAIYVSAEDWLKNAMDIALLTLQRRQDVVNIKKTDIDGDYDFLHIIQHKTKKHGQSAYIKIAVGTSLKMALKRCEDGINSPYLIHRLPDRSSPSERKSHHTQVLPKYLSDRFAAARDKTGLFKTTPELERPTFHEIRSLGIKLYENNGYDAQKLAGHTERKMTELYKEGHGIEWTRVDANLEI